MDLKEIMDRYKQYLTEKYKLDMLEECLNRIEDEISEKINSGSYKYDNSYIDLLIRSVAKSILVFREVILLCKNGMPDGALSLSRNMFEQFAVITRFELCENIIQRDEMVKKYFEDYELKRAKFLKQIGDYFENREDNRYEELRDKIKKEYSLKYVSDYWWCDLSHFTKLVDYITQNTGGDLAKMIINMHALYKAACNSLHGGSMGNSHIIGEGFEGVDLHPQTKGQEYALDLAIKSFIMVVTSIYKQIGLDYMDVNNQLNELGIFYQKLFT